MSFFKTAPRRTVLSFGTFDLSQPIESANVRALSMLGDELILGCATDAFAELHGLATTTSFAQRCELLAHCRIVDRVISQQTIGQIRTDIVNYNVSVFTVGEEWAGQFDDLQDIAQVIYQPRQGRQAPLSQAATFDPSAFRLVV